MWLWDKTVGMPFFSKVYWRRQLVFPPHTCIPIYKSEQQKKQRLHFHGLWCSTGKQVRAYKKDRKNIEEKKKKIVVTTFFVVFVFGNQPYMLKWEKYSFFVNLARLASQTDISDNLQPAEKRKRTFWTNASSRRVLAYVAKKKKEENLFFSFSFFGRCQMSVAKNNNKFLPPFVRKMVPEGQRRGGGRKSAYTKYIGSGKKNFGSFQVWLCFWSEKRKK